MAGHGVFGKPGEQGARICGDIAGGEVAIWAYQQAGTGLSGTGIGSLTSMSYSTCTGPKKLAFTLTATGLPWTLSAKSYHSTKGVAHGTISGITITVSGTGCTATVAGTSATTGGEEHFTYTNGTADLQRGGMTSSKDASGGAASTPSTNAWKNCSCP